MSLLLQISDTHFGTEQPEVVAALGRLSRQLQPDVVVLSGDITQRARHQQFVAARRFVDSLGVARVLAIPGNHDIPLFQLAARLLFPYRNYIRVFGSDLEPQLDSPDFRILMVNTTRPARHKDGEVSHRQIERVAEALRCAKPEQLRIVVTHQPVHVTREEDMQNLLHGHLAAVHAWAEAGADLILGGHIHLPYVRALAPNIAGLPRNVWVVQAGTAVSSRVRGRIPNSVNLVRYDSGASQSTVERWDFIAGAFTCVTTEALPIDRDHTH